MHIPKELIETWLGAHAPIDYEDLEYIAQRAAEWALSQPVSMEPVDWDQEIYSRTRTFIQTNELEAIKEIVAAQLAAARQQGADEERKKWEGWFKTPPVCTAEKQRIAELEVEVKRTSLTRIQRECLRIGEEVQRAAGELPDGYDIHIEIERGAGAVYLSNPSYDVTHFNDTVDGISHCITQAIDAAIAEVKP